MEQYILTQPIAQTMAAAAAAAVLLPLAQPVEKAVVRFTAVAAGEAAAIRTALPSEAMVGHGTLMLWAVAV